MWTTLLLFLFLLVSWPPGARAASQTCCCDLYYVVDGNASDALLVKEEASFASVLVSHPRMLRPVPGGSRCARIRTTAPVVVARAPLDKVFNKVKWTQDGMEERSIGRYSMLTIGTTYIIS